MFRMSFGEIADRVWRNHLGLASPTIIAEQLAIGSAAVDDVGIGWVRRDVAAFTSARRMPVAECYSAVIASAQDVDAAAILLRAVDVVRKIVVHGYVVKLRRRLVIPTAPGSAAINAHAHALVAAK